MKPIRILFLAANPKDTPQIRISEEIRTIDERLRTTALGHHFELNQCWAVRAADLPEALLRYKPNIVHFSGHGSASGQIILEDKSGMTQPVSSQALSDLFQILTDEVQCVVLNACYSESQARAIARHVECVVGMPRAIDDSSAIAFAAGFYRGLGWGRTIETSFRLGCNEIDLSSLRGTDKPILLPKPGVDVTKMYLVEPDIPTESKVSSSVVTVKAIPVAVPVGFALFLFIFSYLGWRASELLGIALDPVSFGVGLAAAGLTGGSWSLIAGWWSSITQEYTPTRAYTPSEAKKAIFLATFGALVKGILVMAVLVALSAFFLFLDQ